MAKLKWKRSYETLKFDTSDGDLHKDQYAFHDGMYLIRDHPENNNQWCVIDPFKTTNLDKVVNNLKEVKVIPNEFTYYDEFILPSGRIYRVRITREEYAALAVPDAPGRELTLEDENIRLITKEDKEWL